MIIQLKFILRGKHRVRKILYLHTEFIRTEEFIFYHSAVPKANMIKFGARMVLDGSMEYVDWYGRGPVPTYCDRKTGAKSVNTVQP